MAGLRGLKGSWNMAELQDPLAEPSLMSPEKPGSAPAAQTPVKDYGMLGQGGTTQPTTMTPEMEAVSSPFTPAGGYDTGA